MRNVKKTTAILSIGIFVGFIIGFFKSGFIEAVGQVTANRYFFYKTYRLAALMFLDPLFKWLLITIIASLVFFLVTWLAEKLSPGLSSKNKKILMTILIGAVFATLFIGVGWTVNRYWIHYTKLHPLSLLADVAILVLLAFFFRLTVKMSGKIQWKALFHRLAEKKHIKTAAIVPVVLLLLLDIGVFLYGKIHVNEGPNVVFIVIDALRQDHLGCYGYGRGTSPNIDALAQEGVIFKNAYSSSPWTKPSVASLFTSLYPNKHKAIDGNHILPEGVLTIAEILKNEGCSTFFLDAGNNYIGKKFNFHQGFDFVFNERINAADLTGKFLSLFPKLQERRFFVYLHYMDVHLPYNKNKYNGLFAQKMRKPLFEPGKISHKDIKRLTLANKLSIEDKEYLVSLYDGQIRFVDENIERIISTLKSNNMLKDTLVVVTSDHGEEFWDHDHFEHGHTLYDELIRVPLVLAGDKLKHSSIKTRVSSVDLLPTVLKKLNVKPNKYKLKGAGLLNKSNRKSDKLESSIFTMGTLRGDEKYGLIYGNKKLIINTRNKKGKPKLIGYRKRSKFEFYDMTRDPLEKENMAENDRKNMSRLKNVLDKFLNNESPFKSKRVIIDKKTKERLKTLGYF